MNDAGTEQALSFIKSDSNVSIEMEYWNGSCDMMTSCRYAAVSAGAKAAYNFGFRTRDKAKLLAVMAAAGIDVGDADTHTSTEASERELTLNDTPVGRLFSAAANEQIAKEKSLGERSSALDRIANPSCGLMGTSIDVEGGYITDASLCNVPEGEVSKHRVECTIYSWEDLLAMLKFLGVELPKTKLTLAEEAAKFLSEPNSHIGLNVGS